MQYFILYIMVCIFIRRSAGYTSLCIRLETYYTMYISCDWNDLIWHLPPSFNIVCLPLWLTKAIPLKINMVIHALYWLLTDYQCSHEYVKCADGLQCIRQWSMCTGDHTDCADGSDEDPDVCKGCIILPCVTHLTCDKG
jgi:hypothetical protein